MVHVKTFLKRPGVVKRLLYGWPLPGLFFSPPPHTAPRTHSIAHWVFLRLIFYLPLHQLLQSPPRARLTCQLLSPSGRKGCRGLCYLYPEFLTLQTAISPPMKVSVDEHQYHCDTGPSQRVISKFFGHLGERKGWFQLSCTWFVALWCKSLEKKLFLV